MAAAALTVLNASAERADFLEEMVVVGTHVPRTDTDLPAPVVVYSRQDLIDAGIASLDQFAQTLPFTSQTRSDAYNALPVTSGASNFNLRGIGNDATLTLVNGRRVAPFGIGIGGTEYFVDINAIPVAAIERIEILKDGASALYGSDAVAGVVNIVTRREFDRATVEGNYSQAIRGEPSEVELNLTAGFSGNRSRAIATLSYFDRNAMFDRERSYLDDLDFSDRGGPNRRSFISSPPTVRFASGITQFDPACPEQPTELAARLTIVPGFVEQCVFNWFQYTQHIVPAERWGASVVLEREFGDSLVGYGELIYSNTSNSIALAPALNLGNVPANHPGNPFGQALLAAYRSVDAGTPRVDSETDAIRLVAGFRAELAGWNLDAAAMLSRNKLRRRLEDYIYQSRFDAALQGRGGPSGDLYYNPFGADPQNPAQLIDWLLVDAINRYRTEERTVDALARGTFGQLAGQPIRAAIGTQFRRQSLEEDLDPLARAGEISIFAAGEISESRDIWAAFAELSLTPLQDVEVQLAVRYEHYDDFGGTTDPKIAARWQILDWLAMRASYGTSFRAPAFRELYDPALTNPGTIIDWPRCEATGGAEDCASQLVTATTQGNPDLDPETSESWFAGLVLTPGVIDNAQVTIDYWRFEHKGRIQKPGRVVLFDVCPVSCVTRAPQTPDEAAAGIPGRLTAIDEIYLNGDRLITEGIDVDVATAWSTTFGAWQARATYTHLGKYELTRTFEGLAEADFAGRSLADGLPEHRLTATVSWSRDTHNLSAAIRWIGAFESTTNLVVDGVLTDEPFKIDDWYSIDLHYERAIPQLRDAAIRLGCLNCTDNDPPTVNDLRPRSSSLHDKRGAVWYVRWTQPL